MHDSISRNILVKSKQPAQKWSNIKCSWSRYEIRYFYSSICSASNLKNVVNTLNLSKMHSQEDNMITVTCKMKKKCLENLSKYASKFNINCHWHIRRHQSKTSIRKCCIQLQKTWSFSKKKQDSCFLG